jgi:hypothetical protein
MSPFLFVVYGLVGPLIIFCAAWLISDYVKERKAAAK